MSQAPNRTRSRVRRLVSGLLTAALAVPLVAMNSTTAVAVGDENPSFYLNANDLDFILRQIQISEAHAYAEVNQDTNYRLLCQTPTDRSGKCVPDAKLPFGVRTVDGTHNNIVPGRERWGSADNPFPRELAPFWRQADAPLQAPGAPAPGDTDMCDPGLTCYAQWEPDHIVYDAQPRVISNLIVDQSIDNPAAMNAAEHLRPFGAEVRPDGTIFLPNMAPDEGLSAQTNAFFTFFGQFFDHGLDLVDKGGNGTLVVPLAADDPIRQIDGFNPQAPYLILSRATRSPGPDGEIGTADDDHNNETTPFVDQNQTYTSHPSHQVFLREYELVGGMPRDTGRLINGADGGLATWNDVKNQARNVLGINLTDARALDVPQIVTDPYGNFVPGPNGFPMVVTANGGTPLSVEGNLTTPANGDEGLMTGHAFLDDIAHGATPVLENGVLVPRYDEEGNPIEGALTGYDNVALGAHFITGDGRGNENIALSAVHAVFHAEHNRMINSIQEWLDKPEYAELKKAYQGVSHQWKGTMGKARSHEILPGVEDDNWSYEQRLFQAARFANEMQYQHLVFEEFARTIQPSIDAVVFNENSYNANIDPAITAEFAHVVYRFGHSMLTEEIVRSGFGTEDVSLLDGFLNPAVFNDGGTLTAEQAAGAIINGTVRQPGSQIDEFVIDTLRNNLLGLPLDLPTINLLRARDAGVPPLQEARRTFHTATGDPTLAPYANWTDFGNNLKNGNIFGRDDTNASLVNFVAAYGQHPSILAQTTIAGKRAAAALLVNGVPQGQEFISRLAGLNRYDTARLISRTEFGPGVPVAYLTTGTVFPDSLAAGALAANGPGPILLTQPTFLPVETAVELERLQPQRIVILGGTGAVAPAVQQTLTAAGFTNITRIGGADRYETAALISRQLMPTAGSADRVYLGTGLDFPDSLAASAIAARDGDPLLLTGATLPAATRAELVRLAPTEVVVLGGTGAVSASVVAQVTAALPGVTITRFGGADRYATAALVSAGSVLANSGGTVYVSTGMNFPDSLAVGPVAGLNRAPVLLVPPTGTVPQVVLDEIARIAPSNIVILGGPTVVSAAAESQLADLAPVSPVAVPADRTDFMFSTGPWAPATQATGLEDVDFWVGGLAERVNPFGGMLGSTFNFVFEEQLEALQFGDRFYYLFRNQGNQLFSALEANSFSSLIERNTEASNLPANIFFVQDPVIHLDGITQPYPGTLRQDPDGTWRWIGDEHIEIHGTAGNDRIRGDEGDDSISAKDGNDFIEGGAGNDTLVGGLGNDVITDSFGDDVLKGGWGNDALSAGPGFDILHGGPGHDFLMTGGDVDNSFGGDGNDVFLGSTGRMIAVTAGEGNDWVEGSRAADLLQGDNADQFQADVIGGNDVVIGRGGDDDIEGEGGDDILVGEWFGTDRHLGNMGFDWITYYGETANVDVDFLLSVLQRPDVTAVRDRYDQLEAMSGSYGNDTLRGIGREFDGTEGADPELHKMTEETLDLVDGLRGFLQPPGHDNYAARFMAAGEVVDTDGVNNIILGGPGSDTLQGRGGSDVLDGDLMLRVQLGRVAPGTETIVEVQDSAAAYQERVFRGEIDPGDFRLVRDLVDEPNEGDLDSAIYIGARAEYTITDLGDGYYEVWHSDVLTGGSEAEESEGADVIRNIELLQFFDGCWDLRIEGPAGEEPGMPCETVGVGTLEYDGDAPAENADITARLFQPDEITPFDLTTASNVLVEWMAGEGGTPEEIAEVEVIQDGALNGWTVTVPFGTAGQYLRARISLTIDGERHVILTPWTANPVTATQVASVIPDLTNPGGPVVGNNVQAWPPTDGNGVEIIAEADWIYRFESAANAEFTTEVQVLRETTGNSWTLGEGDVGRYIRVVMEFVDDAGFNETATTNVVGPVTALPVTTP